MKRFMIVLSLPLAFAMGCGDSPSDTSTPDDVGGNPDNGGGPGGDVGTVQSGLVVAKAPEGLSGDFYFAGDLLCSGASSCEANVEGQIEIKFVCPNHLFVPKTVGGADKKVIIDANGEWKVTVTWDNPGDWGLSPNGTYTWQNNDKYQVETKVEGSTIRLYAHGLWDDGLNVQGSELVYDSKPSGNISDDLKTVTLIGLEDTFVLTLVE